MVRRCVKLCTGHEYAAKIINTKKLSARGTTPGPPPGPPGVGAPGATPSSATLVPVVTPAVLGKGGSRGAGSGPSHPRGLSGPPQRPPGPRSTGVSPAGRTRM